MGENTFNIQWFPGHMAKTRRLIAENLKLVDLVVELRDARAPRASQNPEISDICGNKPRLVILNKADLADAAANEAWLRYFEAQGISAVLFDSLHSKQVKPIFSAVRRQLVEQLQRQAERGMKNRALKLMIVGIPNVGKSAFINRLAGRNAAVSSDRPGVTRGKQWIRLSGGFELLDTPGVLWPKFEDEAVGLSLAYIGAIKDDILDTESLAAGLLEKLLYLAPQALATRYKLTDLAFANGFEALSAIAKRRGFIISGGEPDSERAAKIVLDEFRSATIGRITLELPQEEDHDA